MDWTIFVLWTFIFTNKLLLETSQFGCNDLYLYVYESLMSFLYIYTLHLYISPPEEKNTTSQKQQYHQY